MNITVFFDVALCSLSEICWHFGKPCCLYLQSSRPCRWKQQIPS